MAEEFPRGQLSTIILMCLTQTDKYGYEIIDEVLKKTDGKLSIKQPSLYSSLKRMEDQSLISSYWRDSEIGGRRHYYHLTDLGKKHLEKWQTNVVLPSAPKQEVEENKTTILQQENLFSLASNSTKEETPIIDENKKIDSTFVQYDLFSNNQVIAPPNVSTQQNIFEDKQQLIQDNKTITEEKQNTIENQTNFETIKKFDFVKKGNKSFAEKIKNINTIQEKKYVVNTSTLPSEPIINENTESINQLSKQTENPIIQDNYEKTFDVINNSETTTSFENTNLNNTLTTEIKEVSDNNLNLEDLPKVSLASLDGYITNKAETTSNNTTILENNTYNNINTVSQKEDVIKDDAVLITERLDINDLPKQPKFEARKFEVYISDNSLSPKFNSNSAEKYEDRVKELYEKSKANAENQELELIDSKIKFSSYEDLKQFYSEQNIKFKPYQKTLYKSEKNFDMIRINKLNVLTCLFLLCSTSLISLIFGIPYMFINNVRLNYPITYFIVPTIMLFISVYHFIIYRKSPQKRIAYDTNKFKFNVSTFLLTLFIVPIILAFNLMLGFNFSNFNEYSLTILYPLTLVLIYPIIYVIQKTLLKTKIVY